jgi:type I restriction enzyme R subunit
MYPEQNICEVTERMLTSAGWIVQDMKQFNQGAAFGVAVRKYPTDIGPADYVLFVNHLPFGVVEVKGEKDGGGAAHHIAASVGDKLVWTQEGFVLPFVYESTGSGIRFIDNRDPKPRWRRVFNFCKPDSMHAWIRQGNTLRRRLHGVSMLAPDCMGDSQVKAVKILENSFAEGRQRILVPFGSGPERTVTETAIIYRLLKYARANKILFLADTQKLEQKAQQDFQSYRPPDEKQKISDLFPANRLTGSAIEPDCKVCISTIQSVYALLKQGSPAQGGSAPPQIDFSQFDKPKEVAYNQCIPVEAFDVIILDDCHPGTYTIYKNVLEYFDAIFIGFASTIDSAVEGFFNSP